jgi:DNA-directed RNA polymerase I and III subunit RPAC2
VSWTVSTWPTRSVRGAGTACRAMTSAAAGNHSPHSGDASLELDGKEVHIQENADRTELVLTLRGEGHTLGNALRYMLTREPGVQQVGYTIPHPSEDCLKLYVVSKPGSRALDSVKLALFHLTQLCDIVGEKYEEAFMKT